MEARVPLFNLLKEESDSAERVVSAVLLFALFVCPG